MKVYKNRKYSTYFKELSKLLTLENLRENAIHIEKPKIIDGTSYDKFVRIDYLSTTGSTLLDAGNILDNSNYYNQFKELLFASQELKDDGIFLKIRFLFQYPYSVSAYSRIKAESSHYRASIDEPSFKRHFKRAESLDQDAFNSSFHVTLQKATLQHLQNLEEKLRATQGWNTRENPSTLTIRFTTQNPMICALVINDQMYFDSYLLGKENRLSNKLAHYAPTIKLSKFNNSDSNAFKTIEDHFRYFWELDTTLDCEDATFYQETKPKSLAKIRPPQAGNFDGKAKRIGQLKSNNKDKEEVRNWKRRVKKEFLKFCCDLSPSSSNENIFITCSWNKDEDGLSTPNNYAQLLSNYLADDFSSNTPPTFSVRIMEATPTDFLSRQLYLSLDSSTIGIVMLTKDIETKEGQFICKPNVYHELGYLMKQLGKERLLILSEKGVEVPSNVQDIIRFEFEFEKMSFRYHELIKQINTMVDIPKTQLVQCLEIHLERLNNFLRSDVIKSSEYKSLETKINQLKAKFKK